VGLWPAFWPTRQADQPLHLKDFAQHIGTKDLSRAAHHVRRAEKAGLMQEVGRVGGWVAMVGATGSTATSTTTSTTLTPPSSPPTGARA
jgi:hypothetical protein